MRVIRGRFGTFKLCLESRIGKVMPFNNALIAWVLELTALLINVRYVGKDGCASWRRVRGRNFHQLVLSYGEQILYKLLTKGAYHAPDCN